jgi:DNA-binding NarL/FixJ family response regulator
MSEAEPTAAPVRVLVVDDQPLVRDGIAALLGLHAEVAVAGTASDGQEAITQADALRPDVVLMDLRMPGLDGIAATRAIRQCAPSSQVLVLTTFDDEALILAAIEAGAAGYLPKNIPARELVQAILAVHRQLYLFDRVVAGTVVAALRESIRLRARPGSSGGGDPRGEQEGYQGLTSRELEVLRLIAQGASNREIAAALVITESTVKAHISSLLGRLGVRDRTQAALYARDRGWL